MCNFSLFQISPSPILIRDGSDSLDFITFSRAICFRRPLKIELRSAPQTLFSPRGESINWVEIPKIKLRARSAAFGKVHHVANKSDLML